MNRLIEGNNKKLLGTVCGIGAAVCYGTNPIGARLYDEGMAPSTVLFWRFGLAWLIIAVVMLLRKEKLKVSKSEFATLSMLGLLFLASSFTLYASFQLMDVGIASTLLFVYPVLTATIMAIFFRERLTWSTVIAIALSFFGVLLLYWTPDGGNLSVVGVVLVLISALTYALYIIVMNRSHLAMSSFKINFYVLIYCTLGNMLMSLCTGQGIQLPATAMSWFYVGWLAVVPAILALVMMVYAAKYIGSTPTAIMGALEPLTAVLIGIFLFGEIFTLRLAFGIILIFSAVIIIALYSNRKTEKHPVTYAIFFLFLSTLFGNSLSAQSNLSSRRILPDENYRQQVYRDYDQRMQEVPGGFGRYIQQYIGEVEDDETADALKFLYAYMPQSDLVDYSTDFFEQQVNIALEARKTFSWGRSVPDDIFRHFVLVYRVNNENLDTARAYIFHQLKNRIRNMSMYEAALEVNHWCHEHVDYQPADVRTSAPLATLKTSHGRCGEESTLTVTALRAVGIPARQCYTPRWAHCDDNHAWVEVWVNGKWWFLGACEPDPDLNMGWFAYPATRTMMVHTNVFGRYNGPEEVNRKNHYYSCINVLSNYADTVRLTVTVVDGNHQPIQDAVVRFKLYNYAEYYTLAAKRTNEKGQASLVTGKGDLLVWASKDDMYAFSEIDGRDGRTRTLVLMPKNRVAEEAAHHDDIVDIDIVPPIGNSNIRAADAARQARCDRRKHYEDSLREAYRATFPSKARVKATLKNDYFTDDELYDIVRRSEGNHAEIMDFLRRHKTKDIHILLREYIASLSDKDLRDTRDQVLEANLMRIETSTPTGVWVSDLAHNQKFIPKDVFIKGLLAPRISNELLSPSVGLLFKDTYLQLGANPTVAQLRQYTTENITVDDDCNYYNCPISPNGVLRGRRADAHSLGIFFVALCRAYNVPAYMDNANGELYAWEKGRWLNVKLQGDNTAKGNESYGTIVLHNPNHYAYYPQYTLQRFEDGEYVSYDYENDPRVDKPHIVLNVPAGRYCLSTGNRYSDGEVLSRLEFFHVDAGQTVEKQITLRPLTARAHDYGHIDVKQTLVGDKSMQSIMEESGKDKLILCIVTPGTEPVNHLVKEMEAKQKEYEAWNGPLIFVTQNGNWKHNKKQPDNLSVITQDIPMLKDTILKGLVEKKQGENPVCIVVDKSGTILLYSEGYHIGLGGLFLDEVINAH